MPTIYVVDDDPRALKAVRQILETAQFEVRAYDSARRFLAHYDPARPGCIVCDFAMPQVDGFGLQRTLRRRGVRSPLIFLSGQGTVPRSVRAIKEGAQDFLTKPVMPAALLQAVRAAVRRDAALREAEARFSDLTQRERSVIQGVAGGKLNKQIAGDLGVTERTIKFHRSNLMRKLALTTQAALVRLALQAGLGPANLTGPAESSLP